MRTEIPKGNTPEDNKMRRKIIKEYYSRWILKNPNKKVWNDSLNAYIHVKGISINEILGHAPRSVEATIAQFHLSEILSKSILVDQWPPKHGDINQKAFSRLCLLKWKRCRLLIGFQKSKKEYVLYYISGGKKTKAAR
ncbi:MAG: hypothetical protein J6X57_05040 [Bacteroidales bacterium]|nr:hypothetical protein [Bacteroidales bacterium]